MKKIMVALTAVAMAACAQAAYVDWSSSGNSDYKGGSFYLFDGSKQDAVLALLGAVDDTTAGKLADLAFTSGSVTTKGKAAAEGVDIGSATTVMGLVFTDLKADASYKYITETVTTYTPPSPPSTFTSALSSAGTTGKMAGGGDPTPEPTSGLLLLLGVAGLALRRKQ